MTNRHFSSLGRSRNVTNRRVIRLGVATGPKKVSTDDPRRTGLPHDGLYVISVAARLLEMHPQTLRKYERAGLVRPSRTVGMLRLYSEEDIVRLRLIKHLVGELGLNIVGVEVALGMFNQMLRIKSGLNQIESSDVRTFLENRLEEMFPVLRVRP